VDRRAIWLAGLATCGLLLVLLGGILLVPRWLYPPLSAVDLRGVASAQVRIQLQQAQSQQYCWEEGGYEISVGVLAMTASRLYEKYLTLLLKDATDFATLRARLQTLNKVEELVSTGLGDSST
jgi:hypothetical protein